MKQLSLYNDSQHVRANHGVSMARQAAQIIGLRRRGALLGATDYFQFGLYDRGLVLPRERHNFLGWQYETALSQALNPRHVVLPAWDKLVCHKLLHGDPDIAVPEIVAAYRPQGDMYSDISPIVLTDAKQLARFLISNEQWPLYAKPAYAQKGVGGLLLKGYDAGTASLVLANGELLPIAVFVNDTVLTKRPFYEPAAGYLFQKVLPVHGAIEQCTGSASVSGLRVVVLNLDGQQHIERVLWKIARDGNTSDNFSRGVSGNLIAAVNPDSGVSDYALDAFWPYATKLFSHPDTGQPLAGFALPHWREALCLARRVAAHFPLVRIFHLDIALTDAGPVFLEFNDLGAILFLQLHGRGILSNSVREALAKYANVGEHPWIRKLGDHR